MVRTPGSFLLRKRVCYAMKESWVNVYCTECGDESSRKVSSLPEPSEQYRCGCGREAPVSEFLETERDLEVYESLKA